jgi:hypothetical protein
MPDAGLSRKRQMWEAVLTPFKRAFEPPNPANTVSKMRHCGQRTAHHRCRGGAAPAAHVSRVDFQKRAVCKVSQEAAPDSQMRADAILLSRDHCE